MGRPPAFDEDEVLTGAMHAFRRKGYREGYYGFLIAFFAAIWPMVAWLKFRLEDD